MTLNNRFRGSTGVDSWGLLLGSTLGFTLGSTLGSTPGAYSWGPLSRKPLGEETRWGNFFSGESIFNDGNPVPTGSYNLLTAMWGSTIWGSTVWGMDIFGPRVLDLGPHMPVLKKQYRGPFNVHVV